VGSVCRTTRWIDRRIASFYRFVAPIKADGKTFKAHLDGHNQLDLLTGKGPGGRNEMLYFTGDGDLSAIGYGRLQPSASNHTS
jgi:hypothetical protein